MINDLKFFRETTLPNIVESNSIYIISNPNNMDYIEIYAVGVDSTDIRRIHTADDIQELIQLTINSSHLIGPEGPAGPEGIQGPAGPSGSDSIIPGPQGPVGVQGPLGAQGVQGRQGPAGPRGYSGPKGDVGPTGPVGPRGLTGPKGDTGPKGSDSTVAGPAGPAGPAGANGNPGPIGKSSYQSYKDTIGWSGTEAEWAKQLKPVLGDTDLTMDIKTVKDFVTLPVGGGNVHVRTGGTIPNLATLNKSINDSIANLNIDVDARITAAINSVVADANLMTDALLITESGKTQRELNHGLASVTEMMAIVNPANGMRVFVHGNQGGWFTYNLTKAGLNNGGTIFNGWVRIHMLTGNKVEWWGAKWDGSDTTEQLDNAIIQSAKEKRWLDFGGKDRTYTINTMRHTAGWQACSFLIQDDMDLRGQGCKIICDNSTTPYPVGDNDWYLRVFTVSTWNDDGPSMQGIPVNNVSIVGIDFDTQFDKFKDIKHHIAIFISSGMIVNHVLIKHCEVWNCSGTNSFGCFADYNNSTVISKDWKILDVRMINNGNGLDHSPVYIMADDAEVKVDILQKFDNLEQNLWCSNAIEIHGSNQNVHHCFIDKIAGGIIAGINYNSKVDGTSISSNIVNTYSGGITIWNGEDYYDKGQGAISILGNTIKVLAGVTGGYRKGIGTGQLGNSITSIKISGNHVTCEDAEDATTLAVPIDIWLIGGGIGFAYIGLLNITDNTTIGGQGIVVRADNIDMAFGDIFVTGNNVKITKVLPGITAKGVYVKNSKAGSVFNNSNTYIRDNSVITNVPDNTICYEVEGYTGNLSIKNTAPYNVRKYNIKDEPVRYIDSESIIRPTNINTQLYEITENHMKFRINIDRLKSTTLLENEVWLCTMPAGSAIESIVAKQAVKTTLTDIAPKFSIGDSTVKDKYVKQTTLRNWVGSVIGGKLEEKGPALIDGPQYPIEVQNLILHVSATDLTNIDGMLEVTVKFSYI